MFLWKQHHWLEPVHVSQSDGLVIREHERVISKSSNSVSHLSFLEQVSFVDDRLEELAHSCVALFSVQCDKDVGGGTSVPAVACNHVQSVAGDCKEQEKFSVLGTNFDRSFVILLQKH